MKMSASYFRILLWAVLSASLLQLAPRAWALGADNFANATVIGGSFTLDEFTNMSTYTRETNEPLHDGRTQSHSAWWKWTAPDNGFCTTETLPTGALVDTVIAVYTGSALTNLTRVASGDNRLGSLNSSVTFYATAGTSYYIAVDASLINGLPLGCILRVRQAPMVARRFANTWSSPNQNTTKGGNGAFGINITATGAATGFVIAGTERYSFSTQATLDGYLHVTIPRTAPAGSPPLPPFSLDVDLALEGSSPFYSGFTFSDGALIHGTGNLERANKFTTASPNPYVGTYNASIIFPSGVGTGFARIKVKPSGSASLVGVTGDGKAFSAGTRIITTNTLPFHCGFSGGNGYLNGYLLAFGGALTTTAISPTYRRAPASGSFYPSGISGKIFLDGRPYSPPAPGARALGLLNASNGAGKLSVATIPGEYGPVTEALTFKKNNTFVFASALRSPRLTIDPATGLLSGSFYEPATGPNRTLRKMRGILSNSSEVLNSGFFSVKVRGFVKGSTRTSSFEVIP